MVALGALFLQAVVLTTSSMPVTETTRAPPIVPENVQKRLVAREGLKTFTVQCPAEGASPLYVSWTKDGEPITSAWDRFKQVNRERDLRIKNVMLEDAGLYKCHVANGFGSANMEFTLQVIGKDDPPYDYSDFHDDDQDDEHYRPKELIGSTGRAPFWVKSDQIKELTKQPILKTRGSTVRLKCLATGYPFPDIIWSKNDVTMDTDRMSNKWILSLPHLKASDVGQYTCRVVNMFGSLNATFTVGMLDDKPEFEKTLLNTSISEGQTATFQCKVRSTITPTIKWIKKIEAEHFVDDNKTFAYDGKFFRVLELAPAEPVAYPNNTYMKQLVILNAKPQDAGWYFCVVADTIGNIVNRSANLKVFPVVQPITVEESLPLHMVIGVPAALFLLLTVGYAIYFLQKHQQKSSFNNHSRNGSGSSVPRLPPQPPNCPPPAAPANGSKISAAAAEGSPFRRSSPNNDAAANGDLPLMREYAALRPGGLAGAHYTIKDSYKVYHHLDPMACVPLNGGQSGGAGGSSSGNGSGAASCQQPQIYDATTQPLAPAPASHPYELNWEHMNFSDYYDSGLDNGGGHQIQHYPSMYSCRDV